MKYLTLMLVFAFTFLVGCESKEEHKEKEKSFSERAALAGCTIEYIGNYPRHGTSDIPIVLTRCEGKNVTTASSIVPEGKSTRTFTTVTISEIDSQILELDKKRTALKKLTDEDKAALGIK